MERYSPAAFDGDPYSPDMEHDPSGRWVSVDDPMWKLLWILGPLGSHPGGGREMMRADVLLSLSDAFLAWGEL